MRKILITNDDGIHSDGLRRLALAAKEFGEVWIVAPEGQRSAASHSITLHAPIDLWPVADYPLEGVRAFSCSGTPADCVRTGCLFVMPEKPCVVLSGINFGYNAASDIQYSATAGAAFEASFQGIRAIAFSEGTGGRHETTDAFLREILSRLIEKDPGSGRIWNVNFPDCPLSECRGILEDRAVSRGMFYHDRYVEREKLPRGGVRVMVEGDYHEEGEPGTDLHAIIEKYVSVGTVQNLG